MEGRRLFCFMLALQMVSWESSTSRPLASHNGLAVHQSVRGQIPKASQVFLDPKPNSEEVSLSLSLYMSLVCLNFKGGCLFLCLQSPRQAAINEKAIGRGVSRIGSSPPSCEHKCYGCTPCEAIQVPTTSHVGLQYANYEPEGWKCKCGPSFYSP
ncbi:hypothetical protein SLA2020_290370 [Shorea laevis]